MLYLAFWSWIISFMLGAYALYKRYNPARAVKLHWIFFAVTVVACTLVTRWYLCCASPYPTTELGQMVAVVVPYLLLGTVLYFLILSLSGKFKKYTKVIVIAPVVVAAIFFAVFTGIMYSRTVILRPCPPGDFWALPGSDRPDEFESLFKRRYLGCEPSEEQERRLEPSKYKSD